MNEIIEQVTQRQDRAPYVRFERTVKEDKKASTEAGHFVGRDVDVVKVTPPDSKDIFIQNAADWFQQREVDVQGGRFPPDWLRKFREQYEAWKQGQELPPDGTPIKGWDVISPAQRETLIAMHVLTVEDAAELKEDELRRVGMGGVEIRNKARAWLAQRGDKGPLTMKMAALQAENDTLKVQVETLTRQVGELISQVQKPEVQRADASIGVEDILPDEDERAVLARQYAEKFGKQPHPAISLENLRQRVA